jgi:hypothetical protein
MLGAANSSNVCGPGDGRVKARFVDPDYRKRMEVDDILAALKNV